MAHRFDGTSSITIPASHVWCWSAAATTTVPPRSGDQTR